MKAGFTLIEIVVVIVIIATIATIGVSLDRSRIAATRVRQDVSSFLSRYHDAARQASMTNSLSGHIFTGLQFLLDGTGGSMRRRFFASGVYESVRSSSHGGYFQLSGSVGSKLERTLSPLTHSCSLISPGVFLYLVYPSHSFCFRIVPKTCWLYQCE
ncbi:MAG: prepilin-type N-terminal cleavage/methylation domain-containing protein [Candidatus Absconditabacterales bacterium]|nr:prepilin-type N-terminal cleavage/methylation domain-containing protein [Candidatus Absconditabacterales bacterium]